MIHFEEKKCGHPRRRYSKLLAETKASASGGSRRSEIVDGGDVSVAAAGLVALSASGTWWRSGRGRGSDGRSCFWARAINNGRLHCLRRKNGMKGLRARAGDGSCGEFGNCRCNWNGSAIAACQSQVLMYGQRRGTSSEITRSETRAAD
jgi:hypothetical protein